MRSLTILASISITLLGCGGRAASVQDADEGQPDAGLCGGPPAPTQPLSCFQACTVDSECVEVWPGCGCAWVVNQRFEGIVRERVRHEKEVVEANTPDGGPYLGCGCWTCPHGPPACIDGLCGVRYMCTRPAPDR